MAVDRGAQRPRRIDAEARSDALLPRGREPASGDVCVQRAFVESLACADVEEVELVCVVCDEDDPCSDAFAVDDEADGTTLAQREPERTQARECVTPPPVRLAPVDQLCVEAE